MKLNVILPALEEQSAIAKVLQAADKEIQLLKSKTEKLRRVTSPRLIQSVLVFIIRSLRIKRNQINNTCTLKLLNKKE